MKLGECVLLSCTPDALHLGHHTHLWAAKNRVANAIVLQDRRTLMPPSAMAEIMDQLNKADTQRQELQCINDEWDWVDVPCKIWKIAPVDRFLPELSTCDLATLAQNALPVLTRHAQHLIRRYVKTSDDAGVWEVDQEWKNLSIRYGNLGLVLGDDMESKRLVTIAKNRLRQ
jgi:hypothetical protein